MKKKIIFLDIDGVLNSYKYPAFDLNSVRGISPWHVKHLNYIIQKTDAYVVVSSSWRIFHKIEEIREMLKSAGFLFSDRVIGGIPVGEKDPSRGWPTRGEEIEMYLKEHSNDIEAYVIIDDDTDMVSSQMNNFVVTDIEKGLRRKEAKQCVEILLREKKN